MRNDRGCGGEWVDRLADGTTNPTVEVMVANKLHAHSIPAGYQLDPLSGCKMSNCGCQMHTSFTHFDVDEDRRVSLEEVQGLLDPDVTALSEEELSFTSDRYRSLDSDGDGVLGSKDFKGRGPEQCSSLVRLPVAGLSATTLEEACTLMTTGRSCSEYDVSRYVVGAKKGTTLADVCPAQCDVEMDACGGEHTSFRHSAFVSDARPLWFRCLDCSRRRRRFELRGTGARGGLGPLPRGVRRVRHQQARLHRLLFLLHGLALRLLLRQPHERFPPLLSLLQKDSVPEAALLCSGATPSRVVRGQDALTTPSAQVLIAAFGALDFVAVWAVNAEDHTVFGEPPEMAWASFE